MPRFATLSALAIISCGPPPSMPADAGSRFTPSNLGEVKMFSGTQDLVIDSTCEVRTAEANPAIVCSSIVPQLVTQTDGTTKAIFLAVRDLVINRNGVLKLYDGDLALIIGASGKVTIDGRIVANGDRYTAVSGGYSGAANETPGRGPGAGGKADQVTHAGAGGGGYCGRGGNGGSASNGGMTYGNPELRPLLGGSSGGGGQGRSGAGGGAIQLTAKTSITVSADGVIHAGGGGGESYGAAGGSGGAILLEARSVTIGGSLSANGGSGAANNFAGSIETDTPGKNATPDAVAAPAGARPATWMDGTPPNPGGAGAAAATAVGGAGSYGGNPAGVLLDFGGAGGGGAGRIRINTETGTFIGLPIAISPDLNSACASAAKVTP